MSPEQQNPAQPQQPVYPQQPQPQMQQPMPQMPQQPMYQQPMPQGGYPQFPMQPSVPFSQTPFGKWLKTNMVNVICAALSFVAFLLTFAPWGLGYTTDNGENLYYFAGTGVYTYGLLYLFVLLLLFQIAALLLENMSFLRKWPRAVETSVVSLNALMVGYYIGMFTLWSSGRSFLQFSFYLVGILLVIVYFVYMFKKQLNRLLKIS